MSTALQWASELGNPPALPASLKRRESRVALANGIDDLFAGGILLLHLAEGAKRRWLDSALEVARRAIPEIADADMLLNIALRLWAGCLSAAKTIALSTRSGPTTPESRRETFTRLIDLRSGLDHIYRSGVEVAVAFKTLRHEDYDFDGVPENSPVRSVDGDPVD